MKYDALINYIKSAFQIANEQVPYELVSDDVRIDFELALDETFENIRGGILEGNLTAEQIDIVDGCFSNLDHERLPYLLWTQWNEQYIN